MPPCPLCSLLLSNKSALTRHQKEVHGPNEPQHHCSQCTKSYSRHDGLKKHMKERHDHLPEASPIRLCTQLQNDTEQQSSSRTPNQDHLISNELGAINRTSTCDFNVDINLPGSDMVSDGMLYGTIGSDISKGVYHVSNIKIAPCGDTHLARPPKDDTKDPPIVLSDDIGQLQIERWPSTTDVFPSPPAYLHNTLALLRSKYAHAQFGATMIPYATTVQGQQRNFLPSWTGIRHETAPAGIEFFLLPALTASCCPDTRIPLKDTNAFAEFNIHMETEQHVDRTIARLQYHWEYFPEPIQAIIDAIVQGNVRQVGFTLEVLEGILVMSTNQRVLNEIDRLHAMKFGERLLALATGRNCVEVTQYLLAKGLDCRVADRWGHTALHWACFWCTMDTAKLLVAWDPRTLCDEDKEGYKPFDIVLHQPNSERHSNREFAIQLVGVEPPDLDSGAYPFHILYRYADTSAVDLLFQARTKLGPSQMFNSTVKEWRPPSELEASKSRLRQLRRLENEEALRIALCPATADVVRTLLHAGANLRSGLAEFVDACHRRACPDASEKLSLLYKHKQLLLVHDTGSATSNHYLAGVQRLLGNDPAAAA